MSRGEEHRELGSIVTTMDPLQQWNCCPEFIEIGDGRGAVRLVKRDDIYAIRGTLPKSERDVVDPQPIGDDVSILRGTPSAEIASTARLLPVYTAGSDSAPAVATERIFLRLTEDVTIEAVREQIEALGLRVTEVPAHAPHCAWLEPKSGRVDEALAKVDSLRALPHAANVEPQLLRPRGWKRGI